MQQGCWKKFDGRQHDRIQASNVNIVIRQCSSQPEPRCGSVSAIEMTRTVLLKDTYTVASRSLGVYIIRLYIKTTYLAVLSMIRYQKLGVPQRKEGYGTDGPYFVLVPNEGNPLSSRLPRAFDWYGPGISSVGLTGPRHVWLRPQHSSSLSRQPTESKSQREGLTHCRHCIE